MDAERLSNTAASAFSHYFATFAASARALTSDLSDEEFWRRPYAYGNSVGHLLLHVTGNLNHLIGAQIGGTGYVRDREKEFTDTSRRPREDILRDLEDAVAMVVRTVEEQSAEDWSRAYDAHGVDDPTRFSIILRCAAHFHHHLGQIIYLVKEHARQRV
jgi:uncharacterized damage-inducible protein DinB